MAQQRKTEPDAPDVDPSDKSPLSPVAASVTTDENGTRQLSMAVDDLLSQLQQKFDKVSTEIFDKMDEMSRRMDSLESSILSSPEENSS